MERTPSLGANCNALKALLTIDDPSKFSECILGATSYVCEAWFDNSKMKDKWVSGHSIQHQRMTDCEAEHISTLLQNACNTGVMLRSAQA
jgi:hypothetical protein